MNDTKVEILRCLSDESWWTTPEVARECSLGLTNVSELLRRYRSQGLVNRERSHDVPRGYRYRITSVGLERLHYIASDMTKTSSEIADHIGLSGGKKRTFDRWIKQQLGR